MVRKITKEWVNNNKGGREDNYFRNKGGGRGFKVHMDTSVKLGHLGYRKEITEEIYESENNVKKLREKYGEEQKYC